MSFRTYHQTRRVPARAMEPLLDPAGWSPESLRDVASWSYRITDQDRAELIGATAAIRRNGIAAERVTRENFQLGAFGETLRDVRRELLDGRGIVMLQNFPVDELDRSGQAIAYLGLGSYLGQAMVQNEFGHMLGHVKDLGGDYGDRKTRGTFTNAEMRFHADGCAYVGLLCLQTAKNGGASRVASSVTLYKRLLERRPDLVQVLTQDFYRARTEMIPGEEPWLKQPMFSFCEGYFSAIGAGISIDRAQGLPGVPMLTPLQKEAIDLYRELVHECAADIPFDVGDVQFLNNYVTLHTRRAFEDWPEPSRKRHLLRLWLSDLEGRPIPPEQRVGRSGRGVTLEVRPNVPLDMDALV